MTIYVVAHRPGVGEVFCTYSGMTQDAITKMWAPVLVDFIDRDSWMKRSDAQAQGQGKS